jgi:hypothetical protein
MLNSPGELYVKRFVSINVSNNFLSKLEEYNAIFGQQQIENINYTLSLIENKHKQDKIDNLIKINIQKSILWCYKYNIPCNIVNNEANIFLVNTSNSLLEDMNDIYSSELDLEL